MSWKPSLGAWPQGRRTHFRVWAPGTSKVEVASWVEGRAALALERSPDGSFCGESSDFAPGDLYGYRLDGGSPFPDPASRYQPAGVHGPSQIVDPSSFAWTDSCWKGIPRNELIIYELHVGTFSPEGTFAGAAALLPELARLGVTAIELMPVADFPGRCNWGYDGVALFAPARCYGTPDDLRRLVDRAHSLGIAVLLDVVYNHFGPDGSYLARFSPAYLSDRHRTPWGPAVNLDGPGSEMVRAFFIENALHWIHEYHLDGLRLDATHAMVDDSPRHFLAELSARVREHAASRPIHLIAEDHRNLAGMLRPESAGGRGLDGVWSDDFHHQFRRLLTGDDDGVYRDFAGTIPDLVTTINRGWLYTGEYSIHRGKSRGTDPAGLPLRRFVFCIQNHDRIGNRAFGERLNHQIDSAVYRATSALLLLAPETPLLFMGQEWAASSPFLFFADHEPDLGHRVREGRLREFRSYRAFQDPAAVERIPDPKDEATFLASRLEWSECDREPHSSILRLYQALLALRRDEPALATSEAGAFGVFPLDDDSLVMAYASESDRVLVVSRLRGSGRVTLNPPGFEAIPANADWQLLLSTEDPNHAPEPRPPDVDRTGSTLVVRFHRPGALVFKADVGCATGVAISPGLVSRRASVTLRRRGRGSAPRTGVRPEFSPRAAGMSMSYTALVQAFTPQRNPLCRPFEVDRVLHRCFRSDILPDRADNPRFHDADIFGGLYLTTRTWKDRIEPPQTDHPHESLLDMLFWDDTFPRKPLCILGMVGAGKSTLIDYYLRCYCPTRGSRQADFDKKLVLHFDARTIRDNTDFYHRFFLFLQSEMRTRCLERGFDLDDAVRRRPTQPQNVRQWVHAALEELTRVPLKTTTVSFVSSSPFAYIVLVVDNLDQSSIDVQIRAITEVEQWLRTPSIRLSRVILPMWPSTFRKLQNHQFNLLHGARVFEIGPIDTQHLMANRERATHEFLQRQSSAGTQKVVEYLAEMTRLGRDRLLPRIRALAHENLRLMLALWESFVCGDTAYSIWKQLRLNPESRRTFDYELLDALLVGTNDALDHEEHRIANLFAMGAGRVRPRDILIGHHALQLLGQDRHSQGDLHQALRSLGYAETNIGVVEKSLLTFNFLHEEPSIGKKIEYEIHEDVVQEYLALRFEPAYVDNVAMVTPVDPRYLHRMSRTRGDRAEDFTRRVGTTMAFLEFLRESEDAFRDPNLVAHVPGDVFGKALESLKLVCLWKPMALRYHDRLVGLRDSGYLRTIDPGWWDATLGNPLFVQARTADEFLSPRRP